MTSCWATCPSLRRRPSRPRFWAICRTPTRTSCSRSRTWLTRRPAYYRTHIGVPWGAFVFGRYRDAQMLCSTRDGRREDLGLMFVGFLETAEEPVLQTIRCTIPLRERMITVEDAVNATVARFLFNEHLAEDDRSKLEAWLRTHVAQVFNSLVYICTDQPDIEVYRPGVNMAGKVKKSGRRQQRRPRLSDISEVVQLGFRMGPALHQARQRWERSQGERQTGTGVRQVPHQAAVALPDVLDRSRQTGSSSQMDRALLGQPRPARQRGRAEGCGGAPS